MYRKRIILENFIPRYFEHFTVNNDILIIQWEPPVHGCCFSMTLKAHAHDNARRSQNVVGRKIRSSFLFEKRGGNSLLSSLQYCECTCQRSHFRNSSNVSYARMYSTNLNYICLSTSQGFFDMEVNENLSLFTLWWLN